jgi:CheY-like chemotaxis protein
LSEFGTIILAAAVFSGKVDPIFSSLAIISVIVTMVISSYIIKYDAVIFRRAEPFLRKYDRRLFAPKTEPLPIRIDADLLFFGYYDLSKDFYSRLDSLGKKILVIEQDPENIALLKKQGLPYLYKSVYDPDFLEHLNFEKVNLIVSGIRDVQENIRLVSQLKQKNPAAIAIVTAKDLNDSLELYHHQADYVIYPSLLHEQQVSVLLDDYATDVNKLLAKKITEVTTLKEKEEKQRSIGTETKFVLDIDSFLEKLSEEKSRLKRVVAQKGRKTLAIPLKDVKEALKGIAPLFKEESRHDKKKE